MNRRQNPLIENLESRTLRSASTDTFSLKNGVLTVKGTDSDDQISITIENNRLVASISENEESDETTSSRGTTITFSTDQLTSGKLTAIHIDGSSGDDVLITDNTTHYITYDYSIETRALKVKRNGKTKYITPTASSAIAGIYSSSVSSWLDRSTSNITSYADSDADLLFLGDSHIQFFTKTGHSAYARFAEYNPTDLGLAGDSTSQLLYRIKNQGLLDNIDPKVIVLEIGTNNITFSDNVDSITAGIVAVISEIQKRLPNAKIILNSVLPRGSSREDKIAARVSDNLEAFADNKTLYFLDLTDRFSGSRAYARYYRENNIHLNAKGYSAWAQMLLPLVEKLMNATTSKTSGSTTTLSLDSESDTLETTESTADIIDSVTDNIDDMGDITPSLMHIPLPLPPMPMDNLFSDTPIRLPPEGMFTHDEAMFANR